MRFIMGYEMDGQFYQEKEFEIGSHVVTPAVLDLSNNKMIEHDEPPILIEIVVEQKGRIEYIDGSIFDVDTDAVKDFDDKMSSIILAILYEEEQYENNINNYKHGI